MDGIRNGIIDYIIENGPVTFEQLDARAQSKDWFTPDMFYKLMSAVGKDARISATVHEGTIVYKRKQVRAAPAPAPRIVLPPMDETNDGNHEAFSMMCFCYILCDKGGAEAMWERWKRKEHKKECYWYGI